MVFHTLFIIFFNLFLRSINYYNPQFEYVYHPELKGQGRRSTHRPDSDKPHWFPCTGCFCGRKPRIIQWSVQFRWVDQREEDRPDGIQRQGKPPGAELPPTRHAIQ